MTSRLLTALLTTAVMAAASADNTAHPHLRQKPSISDYKDHPCRRPCNGSAMTCHYDFLLERYASLTIACHDCPKNHTHCALPQCVPANGFERMVLTVNRIIPGPLVDVCEGDTIEVNVENRMLMGEGASIHWHGQRQRGSPHMDGTAMLTQCAVPAYGHMTYSFKAADPGTHYWHAHASQQRGSGLFGGLRVRSADDPHKALYDHDLADHFIVLSDWSNETIYNMFTADFYDASGYQVSSILLNGLSYPQGPTQPRHTFNVEKGNRYRFRVMLNGVFDAPIVVSVQGHRLQVISCDGIDVEPVWVDRFWIHSGERFDFVLHANQSIDNYWMYFKGTGFANGMFQTAVLRYKGAPLEQPKEAVTFKSIPDNGVVLHPRHEFDPTDNATHTTRIPIRDVRTLTPDPDTELTATTKPDKQYFLALSNAQIPDPRFQLPLLDGRRIKKQIAPKNKQMNDISGRPPPMPLLTRYNDIPPEYLCSNATIKENCTKDLCECTHIFEYKLGDVVELVLFVVNTLTVHSMHMHGHSFTIVAQHYLGRQVYKDELQQLLARGEIPYLTTPRAIRKDTIPVNSKTILVLRFRADNPGFWYFHCHIEWHSQTGMNMVLMEGKPEDMPPPPPGLRRCGAFPQKTSHQLGSSVSREDIAMADLTHAQTHSSHHRRSLSLAWWPLFLALGVALVGAAVSRSVYDCCRRRRVRGTIVSHDKKALWNNGGTDRVHISRPRWRHRPGYDVITGDGVDFEEIRNEDQPSASVTPSVTPSAPKALTRYHQ